jgi:DNA-binding response OmpR family regulator
MAAEKPRILLLEDDIVISFLIKDEFESHGFIVDSYATTEQAFNGLQVQKYDIMLVDVMLPTEDGFMFVKKIRNTDTQTPIIFLTARSKKEDVVRGFISGADDYISKPFSFDELFLRIKAVLKRTQDTVRFSSDQNYDFHFFQFDYHKRIIHCKNKQIFLTDKESQILKLLCDNLNKEVDKKHILLTVWKDDSYFCARSMDVFVSKLRKRMKLMPEVEIITIRGRGLKLYIPNFVMK